MIRKKWNSGTHTHVFHYTLQERMFQLWQMMMLLVMTTGVPPCDAIFALPSKVNMSSMTALTFFANENTAHRRLAAVPHLKRIGGNAEAHATRHVTLVHCQNVGNAGGHNIQWKCTASNLPNKYLLERTDVRCEGYEYADDPYVLIGSCGLEYTLVKSHTHEEYGGMSLFMWACVIMFLCVLVLAGDSQGSRTTHSTHCHSSSYRSYGTRTSHATPTSGFGSTRNR
jgi:hypothetical protein